MHHLSWYSHWNLHFEQEVASCCHDHGHGSHQFSFLILLLNIFCSCIEHKKTCQIIHPQLFFFLSVASELKLQANVVTKQYVLTTNFACSQMYTLLCSQGAQQQVTKKKNNWFSSSYSIICLFILAFGSLLLYCLNYVLTQWLLLSDKQPDDVSESELI